MTITYAQTNLPTNTTIVPENSPPRRTHQKSAYVGLTTIICDAYDCKWNYVGACSKRKVVMHGTGPTCSSYVEDKYVTITDPFPKNFPASSTDYETEEDAQTRLKIQALHDRHMDVAHEPDIDPFDLDMSQQMYETHCKG